MAHNEDPIEIQNMRKAMSLDRETKQRRLDEAVERAREEAIAGTDLGFSERIVYNQSPLGGDLVTETGYWCPYCQENGPNYHFPDNVKATKDMHFVGAEYGWVGQLMADSKELEESYRDTTTGISSPTIRTARVTMYMPEKDALWLRDHLPDKRSSVYVAESQEEGATWGKEVGMLIKEIKIYV